MTNEREAAQLERPRCEVEPARPVLMVVDVVGELGDGRGYQTRGMRLVDPERDADWMREQGWLSASAEPTP